MPDLKQLPSIAEAQRSPLVEQLLVQLEYLLEENRRQAEIIQQMRDEIAVLKGQKAKPKFKPSGMDTETEPDGDADESDADDQDDGRERKRAGSSKRSKTPQLTIHETIKVAPQAPIPERSRFKGYRDFIVQDLRIQPHNTCYRLEVWQTPDGERLLGELPASLNGGHFGAELRRYALYQHHRCHVTQPLLHEQLCEWGIAISVGQINALLSGANAEFFAEKDQLLVTSLEVSRHITVDDSGARHRGNNGYVTQIGNDWFAWVSRAQAARAASTSCNCSTPATSPTVSMSTPCPSCERSVCPRSRCAAYRRIPMQGSPKSRAGRTISMPWGSRASAIAASPLKVRCSAA